MLGFLVALALTRISDFAVDKLYLLHSNARLDVRNVVDVSDPESQLITVDGVAGAQPSEFVPDPNGDLVDRLPGGSAPSVRDFSLGDLPGEHYVSGLVLLKYSPSRFMSFAVVGAKEILNRALGDGRPFAPIHFDIEHEQLQQWFHVRRRGFAPVPNLQFPGEIGPRCSDVKGSELGKLNFQPRPVGIVASAGRTVGEPSGYSDHEEGQKADGKLRDEEIGRTLGLVSLNRGTTQTWFICAWATVCGLLGGAGGFIFGPGRKWGALLGLMSLSGLAAGLMIWGT